MAAASGTASASAAEEVKDAGEKKSKKGGKSFAALLKEYEGQKAQPS